VRILTFSTLYPNSVEPGHGIFVETRLRHLLQAGGIESRVVAPVPWFPFRGEAFGRYGRLARIPARESRNGVEVEHPRYVVVPKVGMTIGPYLLYRAAARSLRAILRAGYEFDLIDAHYFYPDGVAAAMLGRAFRKPVVITARGTDINLIPRYALPRRMIRWAGSRAAAMITVCQALKDTMVDLGIDGDRITVLRNGVDLELFHPLDREAARAAHGLTGPTLLSVGYLIQRKGHDLVIRALAELPQTRLLIAGDGPDDAKLRRIADEAGVADRVTFLGRVAQNRLPELYTAADALVLASAREGWANVLLESMACGTPVVASNVWGTPEVVAVPEAGRLAAERTPAAIAAAVRDLFAAPPTRSSTRAYAEGFSWDATTEGQQRIFRRVLGDSGGA